MCITSTKEVLGSREAVALEVDVGEWRLNLVRKKRTIFSISCATQPPPLM